MEETDPARILPEKKQAVEATSSSGGAVPMAPPMGMPMSPHAPLDGQTPVRPLSNDDNQLYTADMPAEGFGSPAVTATHQMVPASHDALIPAIPAETAVHAAIPAGITHSVSSPLIPAIPARPVEHPAGDVHILPIEDTPCTCCGKHHDGQENRGFDDSEKQHPVGDDREGTHDGEYDHDHASHHRGEDHHTHDDHHRGDQHNGDQHGGDQHGGDRPAGDQPGGDHIPAGTHDGNGETRPGEVTDPIPADDKSDSCCACCGDDHPGFDSVTGDKPGTPADDSEESDDSDDDSDDSSNGSDDDDCPADDSDDEHGGDGPGQDQDQDDDHAGDGPGKGPDDKHNDDKQDDDCPADDEHGGDKPGGDKPGDKLAGDKHGDKPGDHRPGDHRPGDHRPGRDDANGNDGGSPVTKPVTPGQNTPGQETPLQHQKAPLAPTESNVAYDTAKPAIPATPANVGERPTMAAPLQSRLSPNQPREAGQRVEGEKLTPTSLTPKQQASSTNPPVTPVTPVTPVVPGSSGGSPQQPVPQHERLADEQPKQFYKSTPPDQQGQNGQNGQNGGEQPLTPTQSYLPAQTQPTTEPVPATPANAVSGMRIPGNVAGNNGNGNGNGNGNNPFTTSGGGPGGLFPPSNGNVGPDPNVKFDENAYNQLTAVVGEVRATLGKATRDDVTFLDAELLVQPEGQTWTPATKLVQRGGIFGGSIDTESTSLEKTLKTFHESLQLAKEVFKETDDLAAYDASKFTTAYPGFNNGGLPGGAV